MNTLTFHKMQGAGNDFIVIDNRVSGLSLDNIIQWTPKLCDRRYGIGADGLLILQPSKNPELDYTMVYRNADGSDAGMCGNGARCLSLFAHKQGFGREQSFEVHEQRYTAAIDDNDYVSIHFPTQVIPEHVQLDEATLIRANAGTEHLVQFLTTAELDDENHLRQIGKRLRNHKVVNPPGTNVNFVCPVSTNSIALQTYERGVEDLTLACGTGALASAIATHFYRESEEVQSVYSVEVKGGTLKAAFTYDPSTKSYHQLILTGPAHFVFEGTISI